MCAKHSCCSARIKTFCRRLAATRRTARDAAALACGFTVRTSDYVAPSCEPCPDCLVRESTTSGGYSSPRPFLHLLARYAPASPGALNSPRLLPPAGPRRATREVVTLSAGGYSYIRPMLHCALTRRLARAPDGRAEMPAPLPHHKAREHASRCRLPMSGSTHLSRPPLLLCYDQTPSLSPRNSPKSYLQCTAPRIICPLR